MTYLITRNYSDALINAIFVFINLNLFRVNSRTALIIKALIGTLHQKKIPKSWLHFGRDKEAQKI